MYYLSKKSLPLGFALMEILLVVGIIGVLVAIAIPAISRARESATGIKCANNLRQLHVASVSWSQENNNRLPGWQTWYNDLRPYIIDVNLQQKSGLTTMATCAAMYNVRPSVSPVGHTYVMNHRTGTKSDWEKKLTWFTQPSQVAHFVDGFATRKSADQLWWIYSSTVYPDSGAGNVRNLEFPHSGKVNIVYMDGHVERFDQTFLSRITNKSDPLYPLFWGTRQ